MTAAARTDHANGQAPWIFSLLSVAKSERPNAAREGGVTAGETAPNFGEENAAMSMPTTDAELVRRIRQGGGDGYPYELVKIAASRVERFAAALVSIGILNASGPNFDPEIDRAIREAATFAE